MLPDRQPASRTTFGGKRRVSSALIAVLLSGCSTMPEAGYPPHVDHRFGASYVVGDAGKLPFLSTTKDVVLHRLELDPQPNAERFQGDARWFVYPPGTTVEVRGALRAYAREDGTVPKLQDLLHAETARLLSVVTF